MNTQYFFFSEATRSPVAILEARHGKYEMLLTTFQQIEKVVQKMAELATSGMYSNEVVYQSPHMVQHLISEPYNWNA